jgi:hypothetical protein
MSIEKLQKDFNQENYKAELRNKLLQYVLCCDRLSQNESNAIFDTQLAEKQKELIMNEQNYRLKEVVQFVIEALKLTANKEQLLDDLNEAFFDLNVERSTSSYPEDSDGTTDFSAQAYLLRKIILAMASE